MRHFEAMTDLLSIARALAPSIAAHADEIDAARRLPADLAYTLAQAGFFRMSLPSEYGGLELPPAQTMAVIEELAQAQASVGWCVMIGATTAVNAAYLPDVYARQIWADPSVITGGVFAPKGKATLEGDHYKVSGIWNWGSGSANCAWLVGGAVIMGEGGPQVRMLWFEREQVQLLDTWHAVGMKGTGSGDFEVVDALVPIDRCVALIGTKPRIARPLYAFPVFGLLALCVAAVALGNARGAIADLLALADHKIPTGSRRLLAERASTQMELAKAEGQLRAARAYLYEATQMAFEVATQTGSLSLEDRANLRIAATHATRTSADVVRTLYDLGGGTSVYETCPLQRRFRDAHVATQHLMVAPGTYELAGRALLGVEADFSQM
ncbi:acyl-CoA dehydrogenase family protein [Candidatus Phycosocius spiralis]|uniref:Hydroxylase n=1 Tax=Candidatus Phycosocius spiralis TaxID=2815099 RepID=A0ABQ4PVA4_9PROT|nr:acyl-CoA dehydrogenase family protein [Candidatus Phycosocius spiralis]GIU66913.1 hydroxylase [Candidatus Phycosocius spiralis]